jgi:hypothetical protein
MSPGYFSGVGGIISRMNLHDERNVDDLARMRGIVRAAHGRH